MTMFTLPNFCRVCLKYDKNLIDLAHIENEPSETLMSKLQLCVSEVEWSTYKPLLCHPCIKRLNIAYSFKKQCIQSAGVLKSYLELVNESQKKNESPTNKSEQGTTSLPQAGAYMLLPNQKYVKILVGSQNQGTTGNTFQNVFLNLIPTSALNATVSPAGSATTSTPKSKDTNQNVFLNLNSTFQKFVPLTPVDVKKNDTSTKKGDGSKSSNSNVSELLGESNAEEMSVEIDPTSFLQLEQGGSDSENESEANNDWDEVISQSKIDSKDSKLANGDGKPQNGKDSGLYGNYVPILPKQEADFFSSGAHFLSGSFQGSDIICEACQKPFQSVRLLKYHIKQFHLGKLPFKCEYCYIEYATRDQYEVCVKSHKSDIDKLSTAESLTLKDFVNSSSNADELSLSLLANSSAEQNFSPNEDGEYVCDVCRRIFNSSTGLLRHKVRKHNQRNRKKYFIKGMKNAKCDICQREFSTQSYMQMHRKLHMRDDVGYKYKVLGKSKYADLTGNQEGSTKEKEDGINSEPESVKKEESPKVYSKKDMSDDESDDEKMEIDLTVDSVEEKDNAKDNPKDSSDKEEEN